MDTNKFIGPEKWRTVKREAQIEFVERKSRFIGICLPIKDGQEAEARLKQCKADYPDARHWVYAWRHIFPEIGGKYSDDGEPQGTAGMPVLDVLRKQEIDQAQILVVRYFGGVLLGTGGLVRAYGRAASEALAAAEPYTMALRKRIRVVAPYAHYDNLRYRINEAGFYQEDADFGLDTEWIVAVGPERAEELKFLCAETSQGEAICLEEGVDYAPVLWYNFINKLKLIFR